MRGFLSKTLIALAIALGLHAAAGFLANGTTDEYYLRFTTERQRSMILGGSRAAQGLHPDILNARAGADRFEGPLYGFAFTIAHSPYGPAYLHAIVEKLDPRGKRYFWIAGTREWQLDEGTDHAAVAAGKVSITPLHLDLTDYGGEERYSSLLERLHRRIEEK